MDVVRSLAGLYGPGIPRKSNTYALSVSTGGQQVLGPDGSPASLAAMTPFRSALTFHNPGTFPIFIAQSADAYGNSIAILANGPGTFKLDAGATWIFDIPGPLAWNGIATGGTGSLTILEYLS